jgi:hypothetical protein
LQQGAEIAHIGERRDAGREAARGLALGDGEGLPQFGEAAAAQQRSHEQPVRLERPPHLRQHTRQIVHRLERQRRGHKIEASGGERQSLLIRHQGGRGEIAGQRRGADQALHGRVPG